MQLKIALATIAILSAAVFAATHTIAIQLAAGQSGFPWGPTICSPKNPRVCRSMLGPGNPAIGASTGSSSASTTPTFGSSTGPAFASGPKSNEVVLGVWGIGCSSPLVVKNGHTTCSQH